MNFDTVQFGIFLPALVAGLLVTATHVPLGMQVLARGIVFIDLAVAQTAGLGVIIADSIGFEPQGAAVQFAALASALVCSLAMTWTEKRWPEAQEAIIGVVFVLAACAAVLLLAGNPHGGEHLRELLVGQILWASMAWLPWVGAAYAVILVIWFGAGERLGRAGFYALFAVAVTISVQLVGLYLVFATLIIPALATRVFGRARLSVAYAIGALGYIGGLLISVWADLPPGALIPWTMAGFGFALGTIASCFARSQDRLPAG
ncbi:MAG: metal ABC transporter permease [Betaproteobacteria bacterium]|nr:metal ABC transporter permease [Betaproteobacteria bacterium]